MYISLSTNVITDTAHSMAAFHLITCPDDQRGVLAPLLDPDRRGLFTAHVRNAFASLVADLLPFVTDCHLSEECAALHPDSMPPEGPVNDDLMSLEIDVATRAGDSIGWVLRRQMEEIIAMRALATLTLGAQPDKGASQRLSDAFERRANAALSILKGMIAPPLTRPFVR